MRWWRSSRDICGVLSAYLKSVDCPVEGCPARENKPGRLRGQFMNIHCNLKVEILQEVPEPLPRCDQCGMHMPEDRLFIHRRSDECNKVMERRLRRRDVEMTVRCGDMEFIL